MQKRCHVVTLSTRNVLQIGKIKPIALAVQCVSIQYSLQIIFHLMPNFAGRQNYVVVNNMKIPFDAENFHIHGGIIDRGYVLGTIAFKRHVYAQNI